MLQCLTLLSSLPSRASDNDRVNVAGYYMALDGVSKFSLETATKQIMQGSLGHGFMPSPPELRIECNQVMRPIREAIARDAQDRKVRAEMARDAQRCTMTQEEKQRSHNNWQAVRARQQAESNAETSITGSYDISGEACLVRLRMRAEEAGNDFDLGNFKNLTNGTFKQVGKAA